MDKEFFIQTAKELNEVSYDAFLEYQENAHKFPGALNARMQKRDDLEQLIGPDNVEMMKDNHSNHVQFMISIFMNKNSGVLVETVLWVFKTYRSHGFSPNYWEMQLNYWIEVLRESLSASTLREILPYYEWMQANTPLFVKLSD